MRHKVRLNPAFWLGINVFNEKVYFCDLRLSVSNSPCSTDAQGWSAHRIRRCLEDADCEDTRDIDEDSEEGDWYIELWFLISSSAASSRRVHE